MRMLIAFTTLLLSAAAAVAGAPCQTPQTVRCQKACAVIGAKFVLSMRAKALPAVQTVRASAPIVTEGGIENAQRLAHLAGLSLDYIEAMAPGDASRAVAEACRR